MTEAMRLNIKDSVERVMFLHKQMKGAMEYASVEFVEGLLGRTIQLYSNKSFEDVREAYEVSELAVKTEYYKGRNSLHKCFMLDGFEISVVLDEHDDGYIPPKEGDTNADE